MRFNTVEKLLGRLTKGGTQDCTDPENFERIEQERHVEKKLTITILKKLYISEKLKRKVLRM